MASFNTVILMGNLTRDPELKFLPSGTQLTELGMAMNRKYRDKNEQLQQETTFVEVTAFGKTADIAAKWLKKGEPVLIEGHLRYSSWEAKEGGKRSKLDVVADGLQLLPNRSRDREYPGVPGEFLADAATAHEDAEDEEAPFDAPFGEVKPSGRK